MGFVNPVRQKTREISSLISLAAWILILGIAFKKRPSVTASPRVITPTNDISTLTLSGFAPNETFDVWITWPPNPEQKLAPLVLDSNGFYKISSKFCNSLGGGTMTISNDLNLTFRFVSQLTMKQFIVLETVKAGVYTCGSI